VFALLLNTSGSKVSYLAKVTMIAVVPSLLIAIGLTVLNSHLPQEYQFKGANYGDYGVVGNAVRAFVFAPIVETLIMFSVLALIRLFIVGETTQVFASASLWAIAHGYFGGWWHIVGSFWAFVVFSSVLVAWRRHSRASAFLLTASTHALYNASVFLAEWASII
jgi:hypothetical protein